MIAWLTMNMFVVAHRDREGGCKCVNGCRCVYVIVCVYLCVCVCARIRI